MHQIPEIKAKVSTLMAGLKIKGFVPPGTGPGSVAIALSEQISQEYYLAIEADELSGKDLNQIVQTILQKLANPEKED